MRARQRYGGGVAKTKFGGGVAKTKFGGDVAKTAFGGEVAKIKFGLGKTMKRLSKMGMIKPTVRRMPSRMKHPVRRRGKPRYGFTSGMNDVERLAPAKARKEKVAQNPPMSRWNETARMKAKIAKTFSPRFGVADFDTHMGAVGNPLNVLAPYESNMASRRGTVMPGDMPDKTARVLAQNYMGLFIPRADHGSVF